MQDAAHHVAGIASSYGLDQQGLRNLAAQYWNLSVPVLYEHAVRRREGLIGAGGAFVARTGPFTGRTPKDKYIVEEASSKADIWWGDINKPVSEERFESMYRRVCAYYQGREIFVQDMFGGADPDYRLKVRVVSDSAWHSLFARNMFIRPRSEALHAFEPDFTILHAPRFFAMHELDGTNSDTFIFVNFARRLVLIGGTEYAGEIKKSVFGYLNFLLPARDVLPMHCSANVGPKGDSAIFFGLSGTGKTTLSADGSRTLIGDDEHGWSHNGLFNFEGGCYAKVINLSPEAEPEIYATVHRFGTVLENVILDPATRVPDLDDGSLTENTRACYPLDFIPNVSATGIAPPSRQRHHADGGRLRRAAADRAPHPRAGHVSLPLGLHGARRRHREGPRQCAAGDVLDLLRRAVHAAPSRRSTPRCWASASPSTRRNAGWSIPAGRAAPTASASG